MLTRILFSVLILSNALPTFSQDELGIPKLKKTNNYWSIGYFACGNLTLINQYVNNGAVQAGYGASLEITYNDSNRDLMLILSKNKAGSKKENQYFETLEFTIGPRFSLNKAGSFFTEFTLGGLMVGKVSKNYIWEYNISPYYKSDPQFGFCLTGAIGKKFNLNYNSDFLIKLRLLSNLSFNKETFTYITAGGGIIFNTKKYNNMEKKKKANSYIGITLIGGGNNPDMLSEWEYNWGLSYGLEITYRVSPKIEILLDGNFNKIYKVNAQSNATRDYITSVTAGGRFLINERPTTAFIELSGGLYAHTYQYLGTISSEDYNTNEDYPGINIGTGTKFKFSRLVEFLLRGNLHFLLSDQYENVPNYLTLQGGLRFNL